MNEQELQLAVIGYIMATKKQPKSELEIQAIAQEVVGIKQSNPKQYQQLVQMGQQAQQALQQQPGAKVAALGAKLDYINKLKGNCPEGTEKIYLAKGGCVCSQKKVEKANSGTNLKLNAVSKFKENRLKTTISQNDTINTKFGPRDLNGNTKFPKWNPKKENYTPEERHRVLEKDQASGKKLMINACGGKTKKKK